MDGFIIQRGDLVLADGQRDGSLVVDGPNINGQRFLDLEPFLFGGRPTIYDRAGDAMVCSFTIALTHDTEAAALDHVLRHGPNVRGVAPLILILTRGAVTTLWRALGAGWRSTAAPAPSGFASAMQYEVVIPAFEAPEVIGAPAPDGSELLGDLDGGDDDTGVVPTEDWDCLSDEDDDGAIVQSIDGGDDDL